MKFSTSRPQTAEMAVSLFARPLHPELFDVLERYEHQCEHYQSAVNLTTSGHVIEYHTRENTFTEVLDWRSVDLPRIKRLCLYSTDQPRSLRYKLDSGIVVQICFDCEYLDPDAFRRIQQESWKQASGATLAHALPETEFDLSPPLSYINVDPLPEAIGIHTFHLYPEECAIVKTQSLYHYEAPTTQNA
ncbi:MAG TPA: hypothetical protein DD473_03825 [Planctomycetaceae bacterium]|nr:hypothetical protein [Planctomycetaceae bacterium]